MRNRILALFNNSIPYVKELRPIAQSAVGCLVMQQLDFRFAAHPDGFYKFLSPCSAPRYRKGDSWTEEIGISVDEFRTAFDKIGIRYKSKTAYDQAENKFINEKGIELLYCSYTDKVQGLTYYFRNHEVVDAALDVLVGGGAIQGDGESPSPEVGNANSRKLGIPISSDPSEITTETTSDITTLTREPPRQPGSDDEHDAKAPKYSIAEMEHPPPAVMAAIRDEISSKYSDIPFDKFYVKWWRKNFRLGGVGRKAGDKATVRQYAVSIDGYFETVSEGWTNGNGSNGKQSNFESASERSVRYIRESLALDLSDNGEGDNHQDSALLLTTSTKP